MKNNKTICSIILLEMLSIVSFAQNYFAPIGSKWYYNSMDSGQAPPNSECFVYETIIDTIINNTDCRKIDIIKYAYSGSIVEYTPLYVYGDTNEVYYYNNRFEKFCLLYKFDVQIGDTITLYSPSYFLSDSTFDIVVDTIYNQMISGKNVKTIYTLPITSPSYSFMLPYCQYIGGLQMMLPQEIPSIPESDGQIRCYSDTLIDFHYQWSQSCDFHFTSTASIYDDIQLTFDDAHNLLIYECPNIGEGTLDITDINGRMVNSKTSIDSGSINVEYLKPGFYIGSIKVHHITVKQIAFIKK